jgi:hypothetical protein
MKLAARIVAAAIGAASLAFAATLPARAQMSAPVPFDWGGFYVGGYAGFAVLPGGASNQAGLRLGYNFVNGRFVSGVETRTGIAFAPGGAGADVTVAGRAGFLIHESILMYGIAEMGWSGVLYYFGGGGLEFGMGPKLSLFLDAGVFGAPAVGLCCGVLAKGGITWHR